MDFFYKLFTDFNFSDLFTFTGFFSSLGILFFFLILFNLFGNSHIKKDIRQWERVLEIKASYPASELYYIKAIRQHASTGTKAFIVNLSTGEQSGAWFPKERVEAGRIVLIEGSFGNGPHHKEDVLYVQKNLGWVPKRTLKNWEESQSIYHIYCNS